MLTQNRVTGDVLRLNSGLDVLFLQKKKEHLLARCRLLRLKLFITHQKNASTFKTVKETYSAKEIYQLKEISKKTGLISFYPSTKKPEWVEFRNEAKFIKSAIKYQEQFLKRRDLSLTQINFLYSVAHSYQVIAELAPKTEAEWLGHSWDMMIGQVENGTGQQKIATFLGRSREGVNQSLKTKPLKTKVIQRFVSVSKSLTKTKHNLFNIQNILNYHGFGGYRINHKGILVRQIANEYKRISKDEFLKPIIWQRGTFYFSNKALNKFYSNNDSESHLPASKYVSLVRDAERFRKKCERKKNIKKINFYHANGEEGEKLTVYPKLWNEIQILKKDGIPLNNCFDKSGLQERTLTISKGESFLDVTKTTFLESLENLSGANGPTASSYSRMMQREYLNFKNTRCSGWGFMC